MSKIQQYIQFIQEIQCLKSVVRTAWSSEGRQESTAEHSWRLAMLAHICLFDLPDLNRERVLVMCLIHDLGELYEGDISAALEPEPEEKYQNELRDVKRVLSLLPEEQAAYYLSVWQEYEKNQTGEARLVKALDKAETIISHNQGKNPADFDYRFNLEYGQSYFKHLDMLMELRAYLDEDTQNHMNQCQSKNES